MTPRVRVLGLAPLLALTLAACTEAAAPPPPPVPVTLGTVERRAVPFELAATGTVEPLQTVAVQPQISGPIVRIAFTEGQSGPYVEWLSSIDRQLQLKLGEKKS